MKREISALTKKIDDLRDELTQATTLLNKNKKLELNKVRIQLKKDSLQKIKQYELEKEEQNEFKALNSNKFRK